MKYYKAKFTVEDTDSFSYAFGGKAPRLNEWMTKHFPRFWWKPAVVRWRKRHTIWSAGDHIRDLIDKEILEAIRKEVAEK